ncbi:DUF6427 family protein [Halocola ammonii]
MILRIFRSNQPFTAIFVILLALLLWVPEWMRPIEWDDQNSFLLSGLFNAINETPWLVHSLNLIFAVSGALGLNKIFNRSEFHSKSNHLPAFFFILTAFLFMPLQSFHPVLPALVLSLPALSFMLSVYRQTRVLHEYFMSGFWIGISALIYLPMAGLFIPLLISILYTRAFNWRELLLPLIAGTLPVAYWFIYAIFMNQDALESAAFAYSSVGNLQRLDLYQESALVFCGLLFFPSLLEYLRSYGFSSNRSRNIKSVFTIMSIGFLLIAAVGVYYHHSGELLLLSAPLAVYYAMHFLELKKKWVANVILALFFAIVIFRIFRLAAYLSDMSII